MVTHPPSGDRVRVFIALPTTGWNGRFYGTGGAGFIGRCLSLTGPLHHGYAVGATDTGHPGMSGSFALDSNGRLNWQAIEDNAYLGIHEMTVVGKALATAFYGKAPRYSYFVGFSTGGRQGLMGGSTLSGRLQRHCLRMSGDQLAAVCSRGNVAASGHAGQQQLPVTSEAPGSHRRRHRGLRRNGWGYQRPD